MPSTSLFGCRLRQLATDFTPFYFLPAVVQVVWLFIYWIGIVAFSQPEQCEPGTQSGGQQWWITFILLALFIAQAAATCAAALVSLRGTPLEPSKRRWVTWLSYAFLASLPINAGLLAWAGWVVEAGDGTCWSSGNKKMAATIFFGGLGVLLGQAVGFVLSYNMLSDVVVGAKFAAITRTGVSGLVHLLGSWRQQHRGPMAQLEGILTELQRQLVAIDGEKTDAGTALACAALVQQEATAAATAAAAAGAGAATEAADGAAAAAKEQVAGSLLAWAEGVCRGAAAFAAEAPPAPAGEEAAAEALHWSRFAAAPYGARLHQWRRGKASSCAARRQLGRLAAAAAAEGAQPLAGWRPGAAAADGRQQQKPTKAERRGFAAARELLGLSCQIVSFSAGDEKRALLPHLVAVDREKQAVVLGIAGSWQWPHAVPEVAPAPAGWLSGSGAAAAEHGNAAAAGGQAATGGVDGIEAGGAQQAQTGAADGTGSWVHKQSLEAAQALLQELERSQLLQRLLRPAGDASSSGALAALDCAGWRLVVAGHGVGGGAAALLAPKLAGLHLGPLEVWAFGLPGELCSHDVGAAVAGSCRMTSVALGDDAGPRSTAASLGAMVDQAVVGLARLRYPKMGLLAALVLERLGPKRWARRWANPGRALRPLGEVPEESLAYLQRYHAWRQQQAQHQRLLCVLPGRVLLLTRPAESGIASSLQGAAAVAEAAGDVSRSSVSSSSSSAAEEWLARWASGEQLAASGIRMSSHALSDHYASRLLAVLAELAEGSGEGEPEAAADGDASVSPSKQPLRPSSGHAHRHSD